MPHKKFFFTAGLVVTLFLFFAKTYLPIYLKSNILDTSSSSGAIRSVESPHPDIKLVALTFDDGPAPITTSFLEVLSRENIKATFFVVGESIDKYPKILKQIHDQKHEIGNHTNTHPITTWMSKQDIAKEFLITEEKIFQIIGTRPQIVRSPYALYPKAMRDAVSLLNYQLISWDTDPTDWIGISSKQIIKNVVSVVAPGSIILLHDGPAEQNRTQTLKALPEIIETLKAEGYEFVTVTELLENQ